MHQAVCMHTHRMYAPPKEAVKMKFISQLVRAFEGVHYWKHNSEWPMIFLAVIPCQNPQVSKACNIFKWIERCIELWDKGRITALVSDYVEEALWNLGGGKAMGIRAKAQRQNNLIINGRLQQAVCGIPIVMGVESFSQRTIAQGEIEN